MKEAVGIPVLVNGDILSPEGAAEALRRSGADGVMLGRGCYGRPWFPRQVAEYLATGQAPAEPAARRAARHPARAFPRHAVAPRHDDRGCASPASTWPGTRRACPARPSSGRAVNTLDDAPAVEALIEDFYRPLLDQGLEAARAAFHARGLSKEAEPERLAA